MINEKLNQNEFDLQDAMNRNDVSFGRSKKSLDDQSAIESE